ncbi:aminoacyl-tRNA hydrolase [Enterobacteriaceae endosymbiont of Donacia versicolorea]|uniref:aminoacyl-tRNA hydrolase n=1 Tax=Enterobacteriaceae endosymbiont of Donacia versicolorea TaxID=2675788 RepID=UPI00144A21F3|nr:aminoacyl-tRNA hydrolase [Enterobacteriaceae endosymbiont of Donacia versicolorea]QJC31973.1 aminoacyl-tRNA hydrolase [Enterobacteriaceae endosymbiont of Donacia versicolorea]
MNTYIKIIIGLGNNINNKFIGSRHNLGSDYLIKLSKKFNVKFKKIKKFDGYVSEIYIARYKLILFIPNSFINNSGKSIFTIINFYKIYFKNILIIHDELDFLPGIIKFKYGGSSGGHNGLNNIIKIFNSNSFYRLRIGIGRPYNKSEINNFVLNYPTEIEKNKINFAIKNSINALILLIKTKNYNKAINYLHSKNNKVK